MSVSIVVSHQRVGGGGVPGIIERHLRLRRGGGGGGGGWTDGGAAAECAIILLILQRCHSTML